MDSLFFKNRMAGVEYLLQNSSPVERLKINKLIIEELVKSKKVIGMQSRLAYIKGLNRRVDKRNAEAPVPEGHTISCKRGCSFCCYYPVGISRFEAQLLVDYLDDDDIAWLKAQSGHNNDVDSWKKMPNSQRKCVFLENNECSVYEDRPLNCRKMLVVSPPEMCDMDLENSAVNGVVDLPLEAMTGVAGYEEFGPLPEMLIKEYEIKHKHKSNGKRIQGN